MSTDPWSWSVKEVIQYFCRGDRIASPIDRLGLAADHARLDAASDELEKVFSDLQVDGAALLDTLDAGLLRTEFGITSLSLRSAILRQIKHLRQQSSFLQGKNEEQPKDPAQLTSHQSKHKSVAPLLPSQDTFGPTNVEATKRRRVIPTQAKSSSFLGAQSIRLDHLFLVKDTDDGAESEEEDNFVISSQNRKRDTTVGQQSFVKSRIQYLLSARTRQISNTEIVTTLCPKALSKGSQLALSYTVSDGRSFAKLVDNETLQEHHVDEDMTNDQWDFLKKWRPVENGENKDADEYIYPPYLESGDEGGYEESLLDEYEQEERARSKNVHQTLPEADVASVIDDELQSMRTKWHAKKLVQLEQRGHQIWAHGRAKGVLGRNLVTANAYEITRLRDRLSKLRDTITKDHWSKADAVREQCRVMEVTLHQALEAEWKQKLWQGSQPKLLTLPLDPDDKAEKEEKVKTPDPTSDSDEVGSSDDDDVRYNVAVKPRIVSAIRTQKGRGKSDPEPMIDSAQIPKTPAVSSPLETPLEDIAAHDASLGEIEEWAFDDLIEKSDRPRLLYKCLAIKLSEVQAQDVWKHCSDNGRPEIGDDLLVSFEHFRSTSGETDAQANKIQGEGFSTKLLLARLWICWTCLTVQPVSKPFKVPDEDLRDSAEATVADVDELLDFLFALRRYQWARPDAEIFDLSDSEATRNVGSGKRKATDLSTSQSKKIKLAMERQAQADSHLATFEADQQHNQGPDGESDTRVVINVAEQAKIHVDPHIGAELMPHQIEGIRFLWREVVQHPPEGCLLSHTMGLGKSLQVIAFISAIARTMRSTDESLRQQLPNDLQPEVARYLVLCPPSLLENWADEFRKWLPDRSHVGALWSVSSQTPAYQRSATILGWHTSGGVLILGYTMFRSLLGKVKADESITAIRRALPVTEMLINGPCLVVADEAQRFKNVESALGKVIGQFKSRARIAMTGSPLSNHCNEYYAMIDWVSPGYLGNRDQFNFSYRKDIERGFFVDSSIVERRRALTKLKALSADIAPKVHRKTLTAMEGSLPPKVEFMMSLEPTAIQTEMYDAFIECFASGSDQTGQGGFLAFAADLERLLSHPAIFMDVLRAHVGQGGNRYDGLRRISGDNVRSKSSTEDDLSPSVEEPTISNHSIKPASTLVERFESMLADKIFDPSLSVKIEVLGKILQGAKKLGEKVLVFCTLIPVLDYLETFVTTLGLRVKTMSGKTNIGDRQSLTKDFNSSNADVFLLSTKAAGVGLNLPAANRVVLFSFGFNPTDEDQAVGRAYRIGQRRPVFVYHFICAGTIEEIIANIATYKRQLTLRVVDGKKPTSAAERKQVSAYMFPVKNVAREDLRPYIGKDRIMDDIIYTQRSLLKLRTYEVLNREEDEQLNEAEESEVKRLLEDNRRVRAGEKPVYSIEYPGLIAQPEGAHQWPQWTPYRGATIPNLSTISANQSEDNASLSARQSSVLQPSTSNVTTPSLSVASANPSGIAASSSARQPSVLQPSNSNVTTPSLPVASASLSEDAKSLSARQSALLQPNLPNSLPQMHHEHRLPNIGASRNSFDVSQTTPVVYSTDVNGNPHRIATFQPDPTYRASSTPYARPVANMMPSAAPVTDQSQSRIVQSTPPNLPNGSHD